MSYYRMVHNFGVIWEQSVYGKRVVLTLLDNFEFLTKKWYN